MDKKSVTFTHAVRSNDTVKAVKVRQKTIITFVGYLAIIASKK